MKQAILCAPLEEELGKRPQTGLEEGYGTRGWSGDTRNRQFCAHHSRRNWKRGHRQAWKRGMERVAGVVIHETGDFVRTTQRGEGKDDN